MTCHQCSSMFPRGYTIYLGNSDQALTKMFLNYQEDRLLTKINGDFYWVDELLFFNMIDYMLAHLNCDEILAVETEKKNPLQRLHKMKPIKDFLDVKNASWIDDVIEKSRIKSSFQPIVEITDNGIETYGFELLSRGFDQHENIIPPYQMFEAASKRNKLFALDRICRIQSVKSAGRIVNKKAFINFLPNTIYVPEHCLSTTVEVAKRINLPLDQIVFEVVETEKITDIPHLKEIMKYYRSHGFKFALDDVGDGFNGLKTLAEIKPDYVKLDRYFVDGVVNDPAKQAVAKSIFTMGKDLGSTMLAEGVETQADFEWLAEVGYNLFQGYYFGKPSFEVKEYTK